MISQELREVVSAYFRDEIESRKNLYFEQYHSSKPLDQELVEDLFTDYLSQELRNPPGKIDQGGISVRIDESPILFWEASRERLVIVYSSDISRSLRRGLSDLQKKVGWIIESSIGSEIVDNLYHEFSPDDESVNIERKWDPYHIYKRNSDIPDNLQKYYSDNIKEFVEQEIEFNLKTPQWMVEDALKEGVQEELLDKSETSKSRFVFDSMKRGVRQDGGAVADTGTASVTVRRKGQVVHRAGNPGATFDMIKEIEDREETLDDFEEVLPKREYSETDSGIRTLSSYEPAKALRVVFRKKEFNEEASIKLSNLVTVGQNDVDLHGVIESRGDLWFFAKVHSVYDEGEYEVLFVGEDCPEFDSGFDQHAVVYIKPNSGTASGLRYIFRKLSEKFDSRVTREVVEQVPYEVVA